MMFFLVVTVCMEIEGRPECGGFMPPRSWETIEACIEDRDKVTDAVMAILTARWPEAYLERAECRAPGAAI